MKPAVDSNSVRLDGSADSLIKTAHVNGLYWQVKDGVHLIRP